MFGIFDEGSDKLLALTDKTIKTTQAKIEQTLRLTFDSFVNSAFLRQGNANEFSKRSPRDRKQIIASILGLDQYETIKKRALDRAREASTQGQTICAFREKAEQELQQKAAIVAHLKEVGSQLQSLEKEEKTLHTSEEAIGKQLNALTEQQKQKELVQLQLTQSQQAEYELLPELRATSNAWRSTLRTQRACAGDTNAASREQELLTAFEDLLLEFKRALKCNLVGADNRDDLLFA